MTYPQDLQALFDEINRAIADGISWEEFLSRLKGRLRSPATSGLSAETAAAVRAAICGVSHPEEPSV